LLCCEFTQISIEEDVDLEGDILVDAETTRAEDDSAIDSTANKLVNDATDPNKRTVLTLLDDTYVLAKYKDMRYAFMLQRFRRYFLFVAICQFVIGIGTLTWAAVYDPPLRFEMKDSLYNSDSDSILDPRDHSFGTVRVQYTLASIGLVCFIPTALAAWHRSVTDAMLTIWLANGLNPLQWLCVIYSTSMVYSILGILSGIYRFYTILLLHASGFLSGFWYAVELNPVPALAKHAYNAGLIAHIFPWVVICISHFSAVSLLSTYRIILLWVQVLVDILLYWIVRTHNVTDKEVIPGASLLKTSRYGLSGKVISRSALPIIRSDVDAEKYMQILDRNLDVSMSYCIWIVLKSLSVSAIIIAGETALGK
jgi:hypothetical protein